MPSVIVAAIGILRTLTDWLTRVTDHNQHSNGWRPILENRKMPTFLTSLPSVRGGNPIPERWTRIIKFNARYQSSHPTVPSGPAPLFRRNDINRANHAISRSRTTCRLECRQLHRLNLYLGTYMADQQTILTARTPLEQHLLGRMLLLLTRMPWLIYIKVS